LVGVNRMNLMEHLKLYVRRLELFLEELYRYNYILVLEEIDRREKAMNDN